MDALELLRNDHDTVRSLFKEFESAKDSEDVERMSTLQQEIFRELELHATIEEEIFYPAARAFDGEAEELMLEGVEEHHVVETLMEEIKQLSPSDEEWAAKMTVLIENVEHHAQEEEEELFPKYREALGERKLAEMGKELEEAKQTPRERRAGDGRHVEAGVVREGAGAGHPGPLPDDQGRAQGGARQRRRVMALAAHQPAASSVAAVASGPDGMCHHGRVDSMRIDRWLWAVRVFKTRTAASDACRAGHVRLNGARAKPAAPVRVGDEVTARLPGGRQRQLEVARVIASRVGAPVAAECYVDHTPAPEETPAPPPVARRERGSGRPSKRERRQLQRLRGR